MKIWFASASALLLACACSASKEATAALDAMQLGTGTSSPIVKYQGKSGSGDTVTLKDVVIGPEANGLKAKTMELGGLDVTEAGAPVLTSITLKDLSPKTALPEGMTFTLKEVKLSGLNPVTGAYLASAFTEAGPGAAPAFEQWGVGEFSINGMNFAGDFSSMGASAGNFGIQLETFAVSDLKDTIFDKARLSGFKGVFDVPAEVSGGQAIAGSFDFGTLDVDKIRGGIFASAFQAAMNSAFDPASMETLEADIMRGLSSPIEPGFDGLTWTGMNADASGVKFEVSRVEQKVTRNENDVATAIESPRATVRLTADAAGGMLGQQAAMGLSMFGYPSNVIEFYGEGRATFDPATDTTRYENYNFGLTDGFDIRLTGGVQGLTEALSALFSAANAMDNENLGDPAMPDLSGLESLKIVDLDLTITDKSLTNLILGAVSMMNGAGDPEALRTDVANMLASLGADLSAQGVDPALANELSAALAAFVKQPGSLNIKLNPAQPVALNAPGASFTKEQLNFSATFTPAQPAQ